MNAETVVSWLIQSDWWMLGTWIVLLGAAMIITFPERRAETVVSTRRQQPPGS